MASVKFHLKLPIFVMRQLVRHRTAKVNEYSGRYSIMSNDCYMPELDYIQPQSVSNKQGRDGELSEGWKKKYSEMIRDITRKATICYDLMVGNKTSNYTECYWKIDLHNFFHFCKLRMDSHAQQEIQDYAVPMFEMVKPHFPIATEAFEDYSLHSKTFSRMESNVLNYVLNHFPDAKSFLNNLKDSQDIDFGMGKREWTELKEKIK